MVTRGGATDRNATLYRDPDRRIVRQTIGHRSTRQQVTGIIAVAAPGQ